MVANIRGFTPNYNLKLINFDTPRWHTLEYANWSQVDALFLSMGTPPIRGEWQNSVLYIEGDRVFDPQTSEIYRCLVEHTSAASGLFEEDRDLHSTYWQLQTLGVPFFRGEWQPSDAYYLGDIVTVNSYSYYLCIDTHVSTPTFTEDAADWVLVFDGASTVDAAEDARDAAAISAGEAAGSAAAAAISETNAATSATNAATSETNAATSEANAANSATAAAGSAAAAAGSASNAADSAAEAANQADSLHGTSLTPNAIALGNLTFVTQTDKQFLPGNFMTIVDSTNNANVMNAQVVSYVVDTIVVDVKKAEGSGVHADWQLYVSAMIGKDGSPGLPGTAAITASPVPPGNPVSGSLWWESDTGLLYVYYMDIDSSQWVIASPQPDTTTFMFRTGDTMTGPLVLNAAPTANMQAANKKYVDDAAGTASASANNRVLRAGDSMSGYLNLHADPTQYQHASTKGYADAVAATAGAGKVNRTGDTMSGALTAAHLMSANNAFYYGTSGAVYTAWNGGVIYTSHGVSVNGDITTTRSDGTGVIYLGNSGARYLYWDGGTYQMPNGSWNLPNGNANIGGVCTIGQNLQSSTGNMVVGAQGGAIYFRPYGYWSDYAEAHILSDGSMNLTAGNFRPPNGVNGGFYCKHGDSNAIGGNYFNFGWVGVLVGYVDNTFLGQVYIYSDYRTKKDVEDLDSKWDVVKKLRPIKFTQAEFTPKSAEAKAKETGEPFIPADDIERWGFIAHEMQETLIDSAAFGKKDQEDAVQTLNPWTVIAALTKTLQEAMTRIEALEAKV